MPTKTNYRATFADGTVVTRTSKPHLIYTHAWRVVGATRNMPLADVPVPVAGFSSSAETARKAAGAALARWRTKATETEIVSVEVRP